MLSLQIPQPSILNPLPQVGTDRLLPSRTSMSEDFFVFLKKQTGNLKCQVDRCAKMFLSGRGAGMFQRLYIQKDYRIHSHCLLGIISFTNYSSEAFQQNILSFKGFLRNAFQFKRQWSLSDYFFFGKCLFKGNLRFLQEPDCWMQCSLIALACLTGWLLFDPPKREKETQQNKTSM